MLLTSPLALAEARRNLIRKAPVALDRLDAMGILLTLVGEGRDAELFRWARSLGLPDKDAPILAAAVLARADLLVTGDRRHFGPLFGVGVRGVRISALAKGLAMVLAAAAQVE